MSELREKDLRWQIAFEITTGDLDGKSSGEIADNILALLPSPAMSGVEAVSTCIQCCGLGGEIPQKAMNILCPDCHGTDKIVRELTEHELAEAVKSIFKAWGLPNSEMTLPSGETLRLKKE